ncbi:MAG: 3-carboxy-cis,cis-muconate cycloisomerase [Bauldia sp.]
MSASLLSSAIHAGLVGDAEIAALLDDTARIQTMLKVEAALARVEGELGIIPKAAAKRIAAVAGKLAIDPASLAAGTAKDGMAVPALVAALRAAVPPGDRTHVHFAGTSQDIIDTALVLALRDALDIIEKRLRSLAKALAALARKHRHTIMPGRTRFQPAVPIAFGGKVAAWLAPLLRDLDRLKEMRPRLLVLSFFGPAGTLSVLGTRGADVEQALAAELGLGIASAPWHTARDGFAELGSWLALVAGTLGKIGADVILLAQAEVAEVRPGSGGGSSTLPHKANPVGPEVLVALAGFAADRVGSLHRALVSAHERDGAAWTLEWLTLPDLLVATGAATRLAGDLIAGLVVDAKRMRDHVTAAPGLLFAEGATYALMAHMPRAEAEALVKAAIAEAVADAGHLVDVLAAKTRAAVDWAKLRDPQQALGLTGAYIDRVLKRVPR